MLKALFKKQLMEVNSWLIQNKKSGKHRSRGGMLLYALLYAVIFVGLGAVFYFVGVSLCAPLVSAGLGWLYFAMMSLMALLLGVFGSVFSTYATLYQAKDNTFLLSMPIPPSAILASRMLLLLGLNLIFGLIIAVPALIMWFKCAPFSAKTLIFFIIVFLALSLFALSVSALFGWLLSLLASKMRRKTLFETILSLAFLAAYLYFYSQLSSIVEKVLMSSMGLADTLGGITVLRWIGTAAAGDSAVSLLLSAVLLTVPFVVVYAVLSRTFIKTATAKRGSAKIKYTDKGQRVSSRSSALFKRPRASSPAPPAS